MDDANVARETMILVSIVEISGSLSNDDGDGNDNAAKQ